MRTFILGASGATGKLLVDELIKSGQQVKIIVRPSSKFPDKWIGEDKVSIVKGQITEMDVAAAQDLLADCQAVASCLGHNATMKGIYGEPRNLVKDAVRLFSEACLRMDTTNPIKFPIMSTAVVRNKSINEPVSSGQRFVTKILRSIFPPLPDHEKTADYLSENIGTNNSEIEWAVVRADILKNEEAVSEYIVSDSPIKSAIFNPGKTSRVNVGHFMARLIRDDEVWNQWKGQMPVIYNHTRNGH